MYSKISKITAKNYNCIDQVTIDFAESPIICLTGDNDAGKSSVIDAFTSLMFHNNERNQKDSIRDGTAGWGCQVELEDSTSIVKLKTKKNVQYGVTYPDKTTWATDKVDAGGGAPLVVQELMGCIREPETKEFLHVRTYRDQLLFITTSSGTNYKMMYGALKAEHISKAIKNGTVELNRLDSENKTNAVVLGTLKQNLKEIKVYDLSVIRLIKERMDNRLAILEKLEQAVQLKRTLVEKRKQLGAYQKVLDANLGEVDTILLDKVITTQSKVTELKESKKQLERFKELESIRPTEVGLIDKLQNLLEVKRKLDSYKEQNKKYRGLEECQLVDMQLIQTMESALSKKKNLEEYRKEYSKYGDIDNCKLIQIELLANIENVLEKKKEVARYKEESKRFNGVETIHAVEVDVLDKVTKALMMLGSIKNDKDKLDRLNQQHKEIHEQLVATGVKMTSCGNCGHMVYVE